MWLDRLGNQQTPSNAPPPSQKRSYSPARRPSQLGPGPSPRPGFSPRASSLSVVSGSNTSTASLPANARLPNGSALKQEITPPTDDPLKVLERILGIPLPKNEEHDIVEKPQEQLQERPEVFVEGIDFGGKSLEEFAKAVPYKSLNPETQYYFSIEEYAKEKDKFEDLHNSILACDDVLKSVEASLASFQKDLGIVSAEIETLQLRSTALSSRLENRKVVEKLLVPVIQEIAIAPAVVRSIVEGPIDEEWLKALAELEKRSKAINGKLKSSETIKAVTDIKPFIDNLNAKATERIRDYLVAQIKSFRSPSINAQIIQQRLLPYRELFIFLHHTHPQLAEEITQAYINTIRWYYLHNFTRYRQALDKLPLLHIDKSSTIGTDPSTRPSKPTPSRNQSRQPSQTQSSTPIPLRPSILRNPLDHALPAHIAHSTLTPIHIETPFHSFHLALLDNASAEYTFLTAFFSALPLPRLSHYFTTAFTPTFALGTHLVQNLLENTFDVIGILLCIRLNQSFAFELQRRTIPVLDSYINSISMLLWPRLQIAMDAHSDSIRSSPLPSSLSKSSTAPHALTQRVGQFLQSVLEISTEAGEEEPLGRSLERLRNEYEAFLGRAGRGMDKGKRERFLGNNYALVLTIIADVPGRLAEEVRGHFEELRKDLGE